jgi:hypothetical protein
MRVYKIPLLFVICAIAGAQHDEGLSYDVAALSRVILREMYGRMQWFPTFAPAFTRLTLARLNVFVASNWTFRQADRRRVYLVSLRGYGTGLHASRLHLSYLRYDNRDVVYFIPSSDDVEMAEMLNDIPLHDGFHIYWMPLPNGDTVLITNDYRVERFFPVGNANGRLSGGMDIGITGLMAQLSLTHGLRILEPDSASVINYVVANRGQIPDGIMHGLHTASTPQQLLESPLFRVNLPGFHRRVMRAVRAIEWLNYAYRRHRNASVAVNSTPAPVDLARLQSIVDGYHRVMLFNTVDFFPYFRRYYMQRVGILIHVDEDEVAGAAGGGAGGN